MEPRWISDGKRIQNQTELTSTPCPPSTTSSADKGTTNAFPLGGIISTDGISVIRDAPSVNRSIVDSLYPPKTKSPQRSGSFGYPLSFLTEGDASPDLTTQTIGEVVPRRLGMTLTCHGVSMKRKTKKVAAETFRRSKATAQRETILSGVSAYFPPGLNALMGPSGCGKTSLLTVLSLRNKKFDGDVRLNGDRVPSDFARMCGYSIQDDVLNPELTARQHLWFSLCLRRPGSVSYRERKTLVTDLLKSLQLENCADEKVGDSANSKMSRGERKRVGIGMELVASPKIIFLDEPTSSLDSTTSKCVMRILKCLAGSGRTIILSIHQPSFTLYRMFDNMTLLGKGRLIYHGPAQSALEYFTSLGFLHQPHYAPPDFFLDILFGKVTSTQRLRIGKSTPHPRRHSFVRQTKTSSYPGAVVECGRSENVFFSEPLNVRETQKKLQLPIIVFTRDSQESMTVNNNIEAVGPEEGNVFQFASVTSPNFLDVLGNQGYASKLDATTVDGVKEHEDIARTLAYQYSKSVTGREADFCLQQILDRSPINADQAGDSKKGAVHSSVFTEFLNLSQRGLSASKRLCKSMVVMNLVIGLVFGLFYYHGGDARPPIQNRLGMFFYLSVHGIMVPSIITAKSFAATEEALFEHEKRGGYYRPISFCISRCTILVLVKLLSTVSLSIIVYWMTGLKPEVEAFFFFMVTFFVSGLACDSLCLACVLGCRSFAVGKSVAILYKSLTSVFAGFLVNLETTFPWLGWIKYISISRYCFVAWVVNEFSPSCVQSGPGKGDHYVTPPGVEWYTDYVTPPGVECGTEAERLALEETVAQDVFLMEYIWLNPLILVSFAFVCLLVCYFQMRKVA